MNTIRDVYTVEQNGERIDVYDWVNLRTAHVVRGHNPTVETFPDEFQVGAGDSSKTPDAVTNRLADVLQREFGFDPAQHGIDVIDPDAEEVVVR